MSGRIKVTDLDPEYRKRHADLLGSAAGQVPTRAAPEVEIPKETFDVYPARCHTCGARVHVPDASNGDPVFLDASGKPLKDGRKWRRHLYDRDADPATVAVTGRCPGRRFDLEL